MAQNFNLGTLGQVITVNTAANTVAYASAIVVGNSTVNVVINSTSSTATANNALYLGGTLASGYQTTAGLSANVATLTANNTTYLNSQLASYYTNATNITTGTLPYAQIPANIINTTAAFTRTGVTTFSANIVISTTAAISANGGVGTAGQVLTSNGTTVYWSTVSGGGGGTPGGSNTHIQFNDSSAFGGNANFTFNKTTNILYVANSIGIGAGLSSPAAAVHANGNIYATGDVVSAYSDIRLKNVSGPILNALDKVSQIEPFYYTPNQRAVSMGADSDMKPRVGVSAQQMRNILPEVVCDSPVGEGYLTVQYERIVPLLIEAIKELKEEIRLLKETK